MGFPLEPGKTIRITGKRLGQIFSATWAVELGIGGLIDLAHAAFADLGGDGIGAEGGAGLKCHLVQLTGPR